MKTYSTVIAALVLPIFGVLLHAAQNGDDSSRVTFEVATIKPTKPGSPGTMIRFAPGARFSASGVTGKFLLEEAYNVKDSQVAQLPGWFDSDRWDIEAKPDESLAAEMDKLPPDQRRPKMRQMIQALLADRFKLVLGHETKDLPVYALIVGKDGSKLHESAFKPPEKMPDGPPRPGPGNRGLWITGPGHVSGTSVGTDMLADLLSRITGRVVTDKTGLTGSYDFTLQWTPEEGEGMSMPPGGVPPPGADRPQSEPSGPSLSTALQEQLGLKLESQKGPMDVLVVQHVEKPSEN